MQFTIKAKSNRLAVTILLKCLYSLRFLSLYFGRRSLHKLFDRWRGVRVLRLMLASPPTRASWKACHSTLASIVQLIIDHFLGSFSLSLAIWPSAKSIDPAGGYLARAVDMQSESKRLSKQNKRRRNKGEKRRKKKRKRKRIAQIKSSETETEKKRRRNPVKWKTLEKANHIEHWVESDVSRGMFHAAVWTDEVSRMHCVPTRRVDEDVRSMGEKSSRLMCSGMDTRPCSDIDQVGKLASERVNAINWATDWWIARPADQDGWIKKTFP